jgi:hypothetical protein
MNLFGNINITEIKEEIEVQGAKTIYRPGVHNIVDTEFFVWEKAGTGKAEGQTFVESEVVFTADTGAKLVQELNTYDQNGTSELVTMMSKVAMATGREEEFTAFTKVGDTAPSEAYKTRFKKDVQAKVVRVFKGAKYAITTTTALNMNFQGDSIFTNQEVHKFKQDAMFRVGDNASVSEIKDGNEEKFGSSYEYWTKGDGAEGIKTTINVGYNDNNYEDRDKKSKVLNSIVQSAVDYYKDGNNLNEEQGGQDDVPKKERERAIDLILGGMPATEVVTMMATLKEGGTPTNAPSIDDVPAGGAWG